MIGGKVNGSNNGIYIIGEIGDINSTYGIYIFSNKITGSDSGIYIDGNIGDENSNYGIC